jgi:iron complex outermembrane receptor protein
MFFKVVKKYLQQIKLIFFKKISNNKVVLIFRILCVFLNIKYKKKKCYGFYFQTTLYRGCNAMRKMPAADNKKFNRKKQFGKKILSVGMVLLVLVFATFKTMASEKIFSIDIPSATASKALDDLAKKTDHALFYQASEVKSVKVKALRGFYSLSDALAYLLDGTGLNAVVTKKGVIVVSLDSAIDGNDKLGNNNMKSKNKTLASAMAAIFAGGMAQGGLAQDTDKIQLEEVVVTAERREMSLQDTPISILAFQASDLNRIGVNGVQELQNFLPNVSIGLTAVGGGESNFAIRGIGAASSSGVGERGVGLYIDDVYFGRSEGGALLKLTDVERIEVLRGPQGTLFGRNNTGGAIRYITNKPVNEFEGKFTTKIGSDNRKDLEAVVNIPFSDQLQARFNFASFNRDGYVKTDTTFVNELMNVNEIYNLGNENMQIARAVFRFEPSDDLTIDFSASHTSSDDNGRAVRLTQIYPGDCENGSDHFGTCFWDLALADVGESPIVLGDPRFIFNDPGRTVPTGDKGRQIENLVTSLDISWQITDDLNLHSTTSYLDTSTDGVVDVSGYGAQSRFQYRSSESIQQEFRLDGMSFDGKLDWVAGVFYYTEDPVEYDELYGVASGTGGPPWAVPNQGRFRDRLYGSDSIGVFGQGTYAITEALNLTVGMRQSYDERFISQTRSNRCDAQTFTNEKDFESFDYRVSADFAFSDDVMTFVTVSKGYKAGGFNDGINRNRCDENGGIDPYDPEEVVNYEVGARMDLFDKRVRLNVTAFYMDYSDMQLESPLFIGDTVADVTQNAGEVNLYGAEAEFTLLVTEGLTFNTTIGTLEQDFKRLEPGSSLFLTDTCDVGAVDVSFASGCDIQDMARAPKLNYTLGLEYNHMFSEGGSMTLTADYAYTDDQQSANSSSNSLLIPAYDILNLRLQYDSPDERYTLAAFGTNVLDEDYYSSGQSAIGFFGAEVVYQERPAEWGVELTYNF